MLGDARRLYFCSAQYRVPVHTVPCTSTVHTVSCTSTVHTVPSDLIRIEIVSYLVPSTVPTQKNLLKKSIQ